MSNTGPTPTLVIKRYSGRRLYNTETLDCVTLDDLRRMVDDEVDFVVYDVETGEDITPALLGPLH